MERKIQEKQNLWKWKWKVKEDKRSQRKGNETTTIMEEKLGFRMIVGAV